MTACLLNGLILTAFTTVGPLFGARIGFDQQRIVLLMACMSLGGLFLQWPIGYFWDKIERLHALIGPTIGTYAIQLISPRAFFVYVMVPTLGFTLLATWRLSRRKAERPDSVARSALTQVGEDCTKTLDSWYSG